MNELSEIYKQRFSSTGLDRRQAVWRVLCKHFFQELVVENATILDMACGYGEFTNNIQAAHKYAIDLNPDAKSYLNADVKFMLSYANKMDGIESGAIDLVFTSNFLEHLPDKQTCTEVFKEVLRVLKPGGKFVILGPNIRYVYRQYWDYFDHYLPLSHVSLEEGLLVNGFRVERNIDRFLPYTMNNRLPAHPLLVRLFLAFPPAWKILGKQFLVVARKPSN